jgi:hypothetical protein
MRSSGAMGFSDVPGTGFCARRASSSFFLNLGTSRKSRIFLSQILLWANDARGKHSQGLQIVGSSSSATWTFAFFGGKLFRCHIVNQGTKGRMSYFNRGSKTVNPMTMLLGTEPVLWRSDNDDQN